MSGNSRLDKLNEPMRDGPKPTELRNAEARRSQETTMVVDEDTGGAKGSKPCQLAWAPPEAMEALGRVYGFGATKYSPTNYRKGYAWSLSVNAMERHMLAWLKGEATDPESGESHMAHVAWHALTLIMFEQEHPDKDDVRWNPSPTLPDSTSPDISTPSPEPVSPPRPEGWTLEEWMEELRRRERVAWRMASTPRPS